MTIAEDDLGTFGSLSRAFGLTTATGTNSAWFGDPAGGPSNPHGLKHMLSDPGQRTALLDFVDEALGPPAGRHVGDVRWIPLFAHDDPAIIVSAVVETLAGSVRVGIGVDHSTGSVAPFVTSRLHVPLVQMPNGTRDERTPTGSDPAWLLIGHEGGKIGIELDATFTTAAPVPGVAHLGGARVRVGVPTSDADGVEFALDLVDLQVPGATSPTTRTLDVDNLATVGADVFEFVVGLVRAQAAALDLTDDTFRHIAGLTGVLGLRDVDDIPELPLADLPTVGPSALVHWVETVLGTNASRDAWLVELARLVGGTADPARDAVRFALGDVTIVVGLRVDAGTGGHPILVPWAEVDYATRAGVTIGGGLDVLRLDTGTGALRAIPQIRIEALIGADSAPAAPRLLATGPVQFGSVHVGVRLDDLSRPQFALTLHDVDVSTGGPSHHHDLIDLSSPDAALDAADDLIDGAIADALAGLGAAGDLLRTLLGVDPPAGVDDISLADLVTDPLGAIRGYYDDLLATPAAMNEVLATLRSLITGEPVVALTGTGDADRPWRMVLLTTAGAELGLAVWRAQGHLVVALAADASTPVLTDLEVAAALRMVLLDANLATGNVDLASHGSASFRLQPPHDATAVLDLGLARLEFVSAGVDVSWHATTGLTVRVAGDGLAVELFEIQARGPGGVDVLDGSVRIALPLPTFDAAGTLTWTPDWDDIEQVLARLLSAAGVPVIDAALELLGWSVRPGAPVVAHLSLGALIADPAVAIATWAAALALDCRHLRFSFEVFATVLSGGSIKTPYGLGREDLPWRAPVAGEPRAPALVAWTTPPCPPVPATSGDAFDLLDGIDGIADPAAVGSVLAAALRRATVEVPGLADLLFAREHLGDGLDQLVVRWTGTDGVIGPTATMPADVETVTMPGFSYDELAAAARSDADILAGLTTPTTAVVHVGCDADWGAGRTGIIDATGGASGTAAPTGTVPATGDGTWFVTLATPKAAAASRTDHDGVAGQAEHLAEALASRTAPVVVVAAGAAAAAALRVAATNTHIAAVVTVGAPWSSISVSGLQSGPGGDALTLLRRLVPTAPEPLPDDLVAQQTWPARRGGGIVRRALRVTGPSDLPSAGAETRRSDLEVRAVFGLLDASDAAQALTATVAEAIRTLSAAAVDETAELATGQPEHLHVGVDVPALSTSIGGITVGAGATIELLHLAPPAAQGELPQLEAVRELVVRLELGVTDGWLLGGPGATARDVEVRWIEALVHVPLAVDGTSPEPGFTEIVLHDAHVFAVDRPRWVIRADGAATIGPPSIEMDLGAATTALPEVKILIGQVIGRIVAVAPALADVFEAIGLIRADGLDPDGLDRLLYDPGTLLRQRVAADVDAMAAALATIIGSPADPLRPPSAVDVVVGGARVRFDLATGAVTGHVAMAIAPMPPIAIDLTIAAGAAQVDVTVGAIEPLTGGVALHVSAATGTPTPGTRISVEHRAPDGSLPAASVSVPLFPNADVDGLVDLAARLLPAALMQAAATTMREAATDTGRVALDAALDALGLLRAADEAGRRSVVLPFGLIADPVAWLQRRADPLAATVALMEALAPVVVPDRGAQPGWPFDPAFGVTYAVASGRLGVVAGLHVTETVDGAAVVVDVGAGLSVGPTGAPLPVVEATLTVDGWGLRLRSQPRFTLELLRPTPAAPIELYPESPGVGSVISNVGTSLVPVVLNALAAHRNDVGSGLVKETGAAVYELGDALGIMEGPVGNRQFTTALITTFASRPTSLVERIPALATAGLGELAQALDPTGAVVATSVLPSGARRFAFGAAGSIHLDIGSDGPWIDIGGTFAIQGVGAPEPLGHVVVEHLRITPTGVQVEARVGPVRIDLGSTVLLPIVVVRAGVSDGIFTRLIGIGVGLDGDGAQSVEFRWTLDGNPPTLVAVTRGTGSEGLDHEIAHVAVQLVGVAVSLASGILAEQLATVITDDAAERLDGVIFAGGGRQIDPTLVTDLLSPERLLTRLQMFAWNCATGPTPLSITIDDAVTLALVAHTVGPDQHLGVSVNLAPGKTFPLASGDVKVTLEVDASWIDPVVPAGLSIFVLKGNAPDALSVDFGLAVAGIGVRFSKTAGPLVELGSIALDGIAVHLYGEATSSGLGGGVRLQLSGLAVAPGGGGSGNGMANSLVNDAGAAGANNRPTFSPSLSVQKHPGPGQGVKVGLRAGDPPGPWFVVIQRQLGPIYVERIGLNTVEQDGKVTRISLLFSGSVSLFGLSAAVDQLSLNWNGGDVLAISSWSADLMGLAVSADMAGVSLAGGLLKSVDPNGVVSYVGMLVGRFATYGLSVFGGYATDPAGHASFFVFGGVTGPIGGPPAFFVTGIGGGLGINRGLVIPTDLSDFATYPFIQALDPAASAPSNPMAELQRLNTYFPHSPGNFWFAAGISFNSFALVDGIAVVAVAFGDGLEINLLGLARMALPRPGAALVSIELALLARFSTREGVFMIKAQLTDNSWLLYEDIRLTGGFAFALWWKGPLAGQFVVTMGGYHPDFHRDGYPDVPRLGLVWQISSAIVMKGESYFALTSEALMAGTRVEVSVDFGWVWARIEFGADGIVYFDPFFFDVRAYCRISAGIDIDLGLFSISLSLTLGASIHVWGPEFAGEVRFEIGPCEVPISFGPQQQRPGPTLDWPAFVTKYLEDAGSNRARALSGITGRGTLPTSTGGGQGAPSADGSAALPFRVFAEFEVSFTSTIPVLTIAVGTTTKPMPAVLSNGAAVGMGLAPMGAGALTSTLTVALRQRVGSSWQPAAGLAKLAANLTAGSPLADGSRTTTDAFPTGVWGPPKALAPAGNQALPSGDVVITGNRVILVAGVDAPTVGPQIDYYQVTSGVRPLPLSATGNDRSRFLQTAGDLAVVSATTAAQALQLAGDTLFSPAITAGSAANPFGRATYAYDRVAPPRFGNLADGLARRNGDDGVRTALPGPATKDAPSARAPFIAAHLASGPGAAAKAATTTVANGRIKRRPAPTVESVRGRMGLHIPATLTRVAPSAVARKDTVIAAMAVPRTDVLGAVHSTASGPIGRTAFGNLVGGIGGGQAPRASARASARASTRSSGRRPRDESGSSKLPTGDLVVLQSPDSQIDVAAQRPSLAVGGRARVVMLTAHGVVHDDDAVDTTVEVPPETALIAVQSDGDADALDGLSGWHDRSRIGLVAGRAGVAAGCTIVVDGQGADAGTGWATAGSLATGADEIHTRFSRTMRTVAVALTSAVGAEVERTRIDIIGGSLATDRNGTTRRPAVVTLATTSVLVYDVVPDRGADAVTVVVTPGSDWTLTAVLGAGGPNEPRIPASELAERLARRGIESQTAQLTVMQGPGCTVTWQAAEPPRSTPPPRRRPKKPPAKKVAAKKVAAKKAASKKTAAKKAPAKKAVAKNPPAKKAPAKKAAAKQVAAKKTAARRTRGRRTT